MEHLLQLFEQAVAKEAFADGAMPVPEAKEELNMPLELWVTGLFDLVGNGEMENRLKNMIEIPIYSLGFRELRFKTWGWAMHLWKLSDCAVKKAYVGDKHGTPNTPL